MRALVHKGSDVPVRITSADIRGSDRHLYEAGRGPANGWTKVVLHTREDPRRYGGSDG